MIEKSKRFKTKLVDLNNKSRKGKYVYIYDTNNKKSKYLPYDPNVPISYYVSYMYENKIKRLNTKTRTQKTIEKIQLLKKIDKKKYKQLLESSEDLTSFAKKNLKKPVSIEFDNIKGTGFDYVKRIKELYK
jgi:hypothetical protein